MAWQSPTKSSTSRIISMSLGGLFILTPDPAPVGSVIKLLLQLPSGELRARGVVCYVKPAQGMGIKFVEMDQEGRGRLKHALTALLQNYSRTLLGKS